MKWKQFAGHDLVRSKVACLSIGNWDERNISCTDNDQYDRAEKLQVATMDSLLLGLDVIRLVLISPNKSYIEQAKIESDSNNKKE